jgi:lipopolysaccharide export system protein LptC
VTGGRGFGGAWDRVTLYLPVILMGVLAMGTYWLARNTPTFTGGPTTQRPATHEPDYFLRGFSVKSFDAQGRLKSQIQGTEARHFPDTDTMEIDQPRILSYDEKGSETVATAKSGLSNADGSEVQLIGNAVVTRQGKDAQGKPLPKLEIRGDFLHALGNEERIRSHKPVTIRRGNDVFEADSLEYNNLDRVLEMKGRVRGTIQPAGAGG